jgi:ATP-dependent phosphoenolpyruvate carboxykinase
MKLAHTRKIINAIHDGSLLDAEYAQTPIFNLAVPTEVNGVPSEALQPQNAVCEAQTQFFCLCSTGMWVYTVVSERIAVMC